MGGIFHRGALYALRWLTEGGPGPLTGAVGGLPMSEHAVVRELAAAEEPVYGRPSMHRAYGWAGARSDVGAVRNRGGSGGDSIRGRAGA
jgi:hypothetical protein